jgi:hypothetical protein
VTEARQREAAAAKKLAGKLSCHHTHTHTHRCVTHVLCWVLMTCRMADDASAAETRRRAQEAVHKKRQELEAKRKAGVIVLHVMCCDVICVFTQKQKQRRPRQVRQRATATRLRLTSRSMCRRRRRISLQRRRRHASLRRRHRMTQRRLRATRVQRHAPTVR